MNSHRGRDDRDVPDLAALAELDADLPDAAAAARLRADACTDPRAAAVLAALAATRAELASAPAPAVPPDVVARWARALAAESATATSAPLASDPHTETSGRRGRRLLVAAAIVAGLVTAGVGLLPHAEQPTVTRVELVALGRAAVGTMDVGDLADPTRRAACLRARAPTAEHAPLLGGRHVVLDGRPGTLLVLGTGTLGRLRLVVVDPGCGTLLADLITA